MFTKVNVKETIPTTNITKINKSWLVLPGMIVEASYSDSVCNH